MLNRGRWANANVFIHIHEGAKWVVKDFRDCVAPIRITVGRFLIAREVRALERLGGIGGVPTDAFRVDPYALAYRFVPGIEMAVAGPERATPAYFHELEALVLAVHNRGLAHLDLRSGGNIMVTDAGSPFVVDFQSHVRVGFLPGFLKRMLVNIDFGGVYKHWADRHPESLGAERSALLAKARRWRKLWLWRPYFWMKR